MVQSCEVALTDGGDNVSLGSELRLVTPGNVAHLTVTAGLRVQRASDLVPHVSRSHEKDDNLAIDRRWWSGPLVRQRNKHENPR